MTLAKKTVILSKNGAKGYITIVRVGSSTGVKYVLDSEKSNFILALKIGYNPLFVEELEGSKGEVSLDYDYDFKNSDNISCLIVNDENCVFAEGGLRGRIQLQDVLYKINQQAFNQSSKSNDKERKNQDAEIINKTEAVNGIQEKSQTSHAKNQGRLQQNDSMDKRSVQEPTSGKLDSKNDSKAAEQDNNGINHSRLDFSIPKDMKGFYYSVKDKLDELFVMYPRDEQLEKIIPCSKWVRINYDKEDFYVAGVLLDDKNKVTHIAYGVPGFEGMSPPKETECICDWLPIKNMQKYQGYWLIFQCADTGEILPKD